MIKNNFFFFGIPILVTTNEKGFPAAEVFIFGLIPI